MREIVEVLKFYRDLNENVRVEMSERNSRGFKVLEGPQ